MTSFLRSGRSVRRYLADRLDLLQDTIDRLGARLRDGIAGAVGEAVCDAVRVAVRALLDNPTPAGPGPATYNRDAAGPAWDAAALDGWDVAGYGPDPGYGREPEYEAPPSRRSWWRAALAVVAQVAAYWLRAAADGQPWWTALGAAAATGAAALIGGPAGAAAAAVTCSALSLVALADGARGWAGRLARATAVT